MAILFGIGGACFLAGVLLGRASVARHRSRLRLTARDKRRQIARFGGKRSGGLQMDLSKLP